MPLAPAALTMLDQLKAAGRPPIWKQDIAQARETDVELMASMDEPVDIARVEDRRAPGPAGDIPVRVYTADSPTPRPLVVFFHGGGFVFCSIDTHDGLCRRLADATAAVVVSVGYRLAPEHRYPAGLDDCYAALTWAHRHAAELGADPARLMVTGDSAGGNLAACVALLARDRRGPQIVFQVLVYPVIDAECATPSFTENGDGYFLDATSMRWFWAQYLGDGTRADAYASPCRAADVSGLPPAVVIAAEYDPLRDEGEAYAEQLSAAGVPVTSRRFAGMIHGFASMPKLFPEAGEAIDEIANALRGRFAG